MKITRILIAALAFTAASAIAYAADDVVSAVHGTVDKVDAAGKTIVVKTSEGTKYTMHVSENTAVHGTDAAAKDSWKGLTEGSEVVAHYTKHGAEMTAVEFDHVGKGGLQATAGTIKEVDRGGKKVVVTTADGADHTFELTSHAAKDAGSGLAQGTEKGSKVVVYSTESAGKKVAHFFEKM